MSQMFLLVDDDLEDADLLAEAMLASWASIEFDHIESGKDLLNYLNQREKKPDLIFLDLNMPGMNGWECLDFLKRHQSFKKIPVLIYSSSDSESDKWKARQSGASGYLVKPGDFRQLEIQLEQIASAADEDLESVLNGLSRFR